MSFTGAFFILLLINLAYISYRIYWLVNKPTIQTREKNLEDKIKDVKKQYKELLNEKLPTTNAAMDELFNKYSGKN